MTCGFSGYDKFYLGCRHKYFFQLHEVLHLLSQSSGIWKPHWSCAGFASLSFGRFVSISALPHWDVTHGALVLKWLLGIKRKKSTVIHWILVLAFTKVEALRIILLFVLFRAQRWIHQKGPRLGVSRNSGNLYQS